MTAVEEVAYWDPFTEIRVITDPHGCGCTCNPLPTLTRGRWADRRWLNVPGPFYGAATDNCLTGRLHAPEHVLYEVDIRYQEFVFRQPRNVEELRRLVTAIEEEPFGGYGSDGNEHWTPETVREWWSERGRVREWVLKALAKEHPADQDGQQIAVGLAAYRDYLDGDLERHLRGYLFFLQEQRAPSAAEQLPTL